MLKMTLFVNFHLLAIFCIEVAFWTTFGKARRKNYKF